MYFFGFCRGVSESSKHSGTRSKTHVEFPGSDTDATGSPRPSQANEMLRTNVADEQGCTNLREVYIRTSQDAVC